MNNAYNWLLVPPIVFVVVLAFSWLLSLVSSRLAFKGGKQTAGKFKAYACGEDVPCHRMQPDYSQFFPFAFFFTIMHVVALIVATVPLGAIKLYGVVALYLLAALTGLFVLFRR
jgi:NADH-quinone oxidoreductase subunit A